MDEETSLVLGLLATFGAVFAVIGLIFYLFDAIARFKYLKVRGYASAWLGFIPIANVYATVEATYGRAEQISVYGLKLPSILVKLFPLILGGISAVLSAIPFINSIAGLVTIVIQVAVMVMIYKDMMYRIDQEVSTGFAVLASIITIVGSIKMISACSGLGDGEYDYARDSRDLSSQDGSGPLSGIGKK